MREKSVRVRVARTPMAAPLAAATRVTFRRWFIASDYSLNYGATSISKLEKPEALARVWRPARRDASGQRLA
jgi:hypothetical protein